MSPQDALGTIAEVGIAIAGFGGVIAAIASVRPGGLTELARSHFGALLRGSIMIVCFAIIPQILGAADVSDETLWTASSSLHAFYIVAIVRFRALQLRRAGGTLASLGWAIGVVLLAAAVQLGNALWFRMAWIYLAALLVVVLGVFQVFPRLLTEIWEDHSVPETE